MVQSLAAGRPYSPSNHLFVGDITTSACSQVILGDISLTTNFVPLPPSIGPMLAVWFGLAIIHGRRTRSQ